MELTLQRISYGELGTFGVILNNDKPWMVTLELPWRNNLRKVSCIPAGRYSMTWMYSMKFLRHLFVLGMVPGRDFIELHIGNTIKDTEGCILLGTSFSLTEYAIMNSKNAFESFNNMVTKEGSFLTVKDLNNETKIITTNQV